MTPTCPNCRSTHVTPDASNGGAGRDVCQACGYREAVREFYEPRPKHGELRISHRQEDDAVVYKAELFIDTNRLRTDRPAAPIRQYKDD